MQPAHANAFKGLRTTNWELIATLDTSARKCDSRTFSFQSVFRSKGVLARAARGVLLEHVGALGWLLCTPLYSRCSCTHLDHGGRGMPTVEYWIQIEQHAWDACPLNIDRMTGQTVNSASTVPFVPGGVCSPMAKPLDKDALILRRYTANWAAPDDRKVNPWDLNEPDPALTHGTIPGPVIECDLATSDDVIVHFRNMDLRKDSSGNLLAPETRAHSLHPHGFVFAPQFDGAYPLSPPDPAQPIAAPQAAAWSLLGVSGLKQGDRVPAPVVAGGEAGTFDYHWQTIGWPTTAGVWLYHDHSICDMDNVNAGAIGIIVIHNSNDPEDVLAQDLPGGSATGSPLELFCFPPPFPIPILSHAAELIGRSHSSPGAIPQGDEMAEMTEVEGDVGHAPSRPDDEEGSAHEVAHLADLDHVLLDLDLEDLLIRRFCFRRYRTPERALYLQLYHTLGSAGVCINGRTFLGNTPTMIAGETTHMRFGVVGMGSEFHTFHIHGHRWILPGPHGNDLATIQGSPQDQAVTQFEDTRIFGPANSFVFTVHEGDGFMRPPPGLAPGEWHMHCHVLNHMMMGMMGSLLVVRPGALFARLPQGRPCPTGPAPPPLTVTVKNFQFNPSTINVPAGSTLIFDFQEANHTVKTVSTTMGAGAITINNGGGDFDAVAPTPQQKAVVISGMAGATINYQCGIHTTLMPGVINIV